MTSSRVMDQRLPAARIEWVDVAKGLGISAVVVGHIWADGKDYLNWFTMPLFFLLSGYLFKPAPMGAYFFAKTRQLLLPYVIFLILLSTIHDSWRLVEIVNSPEQVSPVAFARYLYYKLFGGDLLVMWFGTFWFLTCLFLTQQLFNIFYLKFGERAWPPALLAGVSFLAASLMDYFLPGLRLPWSANVVLMALPFFFIGHVVRRARVDITQFTLLPLAIIVSAIIVHHYGYLDVTYEMKYGNYGVPVYSLLIAMSLCILVARLAMFAVHYAPLKRVLAALGQASLVIMLLHQAIQYSLSKVPALEAEWIRIGAALLFSYLAYAILRRFSFTRQIILGERARSEHPSSLFDGLQSKPIQH